MTKRKVKPEIEITTIEEGLDALDRGMKVPDWVCREALELLPDHTEGDVVTNLHRALHRAANVDEESRTRLRRRAIFAAALRLIAMMG